MNRLLFKEMLEPPSDALFAGKNPIGRLGQTLRVWNGLSSSHNLINKTLTDSRHRIPSFISLANNDRCGEVTCIEGIFLLGCIKAIGKDRTRSGSYSNEVDVSG